MEEPQNTFSDPRAAAPSPARQSWGALLSIIVILGMIVVGAYYAWSKSMQERAAPQTEAARAAVNL
jgi:hypothetical protein